MNGCLHDPTTLGEFSDHFGVVFEAPTVLFHLALAVSISTSRCVCSLSHHDGTAAA